jgi:hypothetical protein
LRTIARLPTAHAMASRPSAEHRTALAAEDCSAGRTGVDGYEYQALLTTDVKIPRPFA